MSTQAAVGGRGTTTIIPSGSQGRPLRLAVYISTGIGVLCLPLVLDRLFLLSVTQALAVAIGAIGLNLLIGAANQLSLAHPFYMALGAYSYCVLASTHDSGANAGLVAIGLPPIVAIVASVMLAGIAGLALTPIAARLSGIYLAVSSIGLVFIGEHITLNARSLTGGVNGRSAPSVEVGPFRFSDGASIGSVELDASAFRWYLVAICLCVGLLFGINLLRGRPGLALFAMRERAAAAAVLGVEVGVYRAKLFMLSSMYAGLSGVLLAISLQAVVPDLFGLGLVVTLVTISVVGGLSSVWGAVVGALVVMVGRDLIIHFSSSLPFIAQPGGGGLSAAEAATYVYGIVLVLCLLYLPSGIAGITRKWRRDIESSLRRTDSRVGAAGEGQG
ncbi:MAG: branched-chain amino acid ABC transporter permease [Acidimicrobiia bacterium]